MKNQMYKFILFLVPAMLLLSCTKDKFSEKDALDAQQTIDLLITVVDASSSLTPVTGATVNVVLGNKVVTQTTDANGITVFAKISIGGTVVVTVSKTAYTSILTTVNTNPTSYRQSQVSQVIFVYSKDAAKMATFKGRLTLESDLTNRKRESAASAVVKAKNTSLPSTVTEQLFTATTNDSGKYVLTVPVTGSGDNIQLYYPDLVVNQKLAFIQENMTIAVAERSVLYKYNKSAGFTIPSIPSALATIEAPASTTVGSGFAMGAKANRVALSSINSFYYLLDGGTGYNGGATGSYEIPFTADKSGKIAKLSVNLTGGKITSVNGVNDYTATYDVAPTLNHSALTTQPTTQANIGLFFRTSYKLYISNKGSSYTSFPQVSAEANNYSSYTLVRRVDPDINDGSDSFFGYTYVLSNYSGIIGGLIKSLTGNGDTLITATSYLASAPIFSVVDLATQKAVLSISTGNIASDSTLASISIDNYGLGYNPATPPVVTITALGGWGSGAVAKATVSTSTWLSSIYITNPGKKYVQNVNDYRNQGVTWSTYDDPTFAGYSSVSFSGIKLGDVTVQDVYYGTGYQIINQDQAK